MKTYTVTVTFAVPTAANEHLRTQRAVSDEIRSWLESLNATVSDIRVTTGRRENEK